MIWADTDPWLGHPKRPARRSPIRGVSQFQGQNIRKLPRSLWILGTLATPEIHLKFLWSIYDVLKNNWLFTGFLDLKRPSQALVSTLGSQSCVAEACQVCQGWQTVWKVYVIPCWAACRVDLTPMFKEYQRIPEAVETVVKVLRSSLVWQKQFRMASVWVAGVESVFESQPSCKNTFRKDGNPHS